MDELMDTPRGVGAKRLRLSKSSSLELEPHESSQQFCSTPSHLMYNKKILESVIHTEFPNSSNTSKDIVSENANSIINNFRTPVSKHKRPTPGCSSVVSVSSLSSASSLSVESISATKVNPFERGILANLRNSFWSPNIFPPNSELLETPPQTNWAIDQLAILFPKAIEDSPSTHQNELKLTPSTEAKAQADIENYFSQSCVLPSPAVPTPNPNNISTMSTNRLMSAMEICSDSPQVPAIIVQSQVSCNSTSTASINRLPSSTSKSMKDSWTSTLLSLPSRLPPDVEAILKPYMQNVHDHASLSSSVTHENNHNISHKTPDHASNPNSSKRNAILGPCLYLNTSGPNGGSSRRRRLAFSSADEDEDDNRNCSQLDVSYEEFSPSPMQISVHSPMLMITPSKENSSPACFVRDGVQIRRSEFTPSNRMTQLHSPNLTPIRRPHVSNKTATGKTLDLSPD